MKKAAWELLFPSTTMRAAVQESGRRLTDREKAALLCHWDDIGTRWRQGLSVLRNATEDSTLKRQITEYLEREEAAYALFQKNEDRRHVYDLRQEDVQTRHYMQYGDALREGRKTGKAFWINRRDLGEAYNALPYWKRKEYPDSVVAQIWYNEKGAPVSFRSIEIPMAYETAEDDWRNRFECLYVPLPYPFAPGDVVVDLRTGDMGVVRSTWEEMEQRQHSEKRPADWTANDVRVLLLDKDGFFETRDISLIYLQLGPQTLTECKSDTERTAVFASQMVLDGRTPYMVRDAWLHCKGQW